MTRPTARMRAADTVWGLEDKAGKIDHSKVKVIWESPTYPDYQWTVRGDVDNTFLAKDYNVIRDKIDLGYKESITNFMDKIGRGKIVVIVRNNFV